jgi:hypothetical protein
MFFECCKKKEQQNEQSPVLRAEEIKLSQIDIIFGNY